MLNKSFLRSTLVEHVAALPGPLASFPASALSLLFSEITSQLNYLHLNPASAFGRPKLRQ